MPRTHPEIIYEAEMAQFLSENHEARGSVTVVTVTSGEWFAAKNLPVYDRKLISG